MVKKYLYLSYIILGLILFGFYMHRINPDGLSYFTIAKNYAQGYFVINSFWSPLLSWILIPFYFLGISPFFGFNLIQLLIGLFTLFALEKLTNLFPISEDIKPFVLAASIPFILYCAFSVITPDLLSACLLLYYFISIFSTKTQGFRAGIFGALAYLTKAYTFYFFLAHFSFMMLYKRDMKNYVKGIGIFIVITGIWIGLQSRQVHHITIGTAGTYNYKTSRPGGVNKPFLYDGLQKPPLHAGSSWYDPSTLPILYHKPRTIFAEINGWISIISHNILEEIYQYEGFSLFAFIILFYAFMHVKNPQLRIPLITFLLFSSGYLLYHVEDRYIWFPVLLLLLMAASIKTHKLVIVLILISFIIIPCKRLLFHLNDNRDIYTISKSLYLQGNIASNGDYNNSLFLSYYHNAVYFGIPIGNVDAINKSIRENHINYFLSWSDIPTYSFITQFTKVESEGGVTVYKIQ